MKIKACLTNNSDLWKTPTNLYKIFIDNDWFDPCPTNPTFNGLEIDWKRKNFVNPPYSEIDKWVDKAILECKNKCNSILLIPARTDTKWFRKLVEHGAKIIFLQGRLHFNNSLSAPFPSMLVDLHWYDKPNEPKFEYLEKENRWWE